MTLTGYTTKCAILFPKVTQRVTISVPKVHVFGHIHNGYGQKQIGQTLYVNAAVCDEDYKPVNAPIVVDI